MTPPLVTVICLCYNHRLFIREAVESVLQQTYPNIQLVIVDDASTDNSQEEINKLAAEYSLQEVVLLKTNHGSCAAFNRGLALAKGDFVIDLAADDVLLPNRIEAGVEAFMSAGMSCGIHFSNAEYINETGMHLGYHADRFPHEQIPQGDIYQALLTRYFICPPSLMFRRDVYAQLGGYDETLHYEDFDFLMRASRDFHASYSPEVLVKRRVLRNSLAQQQFRFFSAHARTTYRVLEKVMQMNREEAERKALNIRIRYEMGQCLKQLNFRLLIRYANLWMANQRQQHLPDR